MITLPSVRQLGYLVHDMSNDALKEGGKYPDAGKAPWTKELIERHVRLLRAARSRGVTIFYSGHYLRPDYKDAVQGGNSPRYGALQAGTWGAEPIDELKPEPGDWIIRKGGGMSAFTGTPFEKWLRRQGITTVIVAGIATHAGVESTVRDMRERDFFAVVVSDACRANPENHEASLLNMATFCQVGTTDEVIEALMKAPD